MSLDLRIPVGLMFTITGVILSVFGYATRDDAALYAKSLGIDANLWWGLALFAFGLTMYSLGVRRQRRLEKKLPAPVDKERARRGR